MKNNLLPIAVPLIVLGLTFIYGCSEKGERGVKFSTDSQSITFDFSPNFNINNDFSFECNIKLLEKPLIITTEHLIVENGFLTKIQSNSLSNISIIDL